MVTGNSDFRAAGGEISGHCPPHTILRQGGPVDQPEHPRAARATRDHGKKHTLSSRICLAVRCLMQKCLKLKIDLTVKQPPQLQLRVDRLASCHRSCLLGFNAGIEGAERLAQPLATQSMATASPATASKLG